MSLRSTLAALAAVLTLALPLAASAQTKMGYVDSQRVLFQIDEGKATMSRLEKWRDGREKELKKEEDVLLKEKELLQKQSSAMSQETLAQRSTDFQKKALEFMQKVERSRAEVANRERQEMEPILAKLKGVINKIAEREGLAFVFEAGGAGLVYAQPQYDIGNEVIRAYNALPKTAAPAAPAPGAPVAKDAPAAKDAPKK